MSSEIVFTLEPDTGRVCVESSNAPLGVVNEIKRDLGQAIVLNCGRPNVSLDKSQSHEIFEEPFSKNEVVESGEIIHLFRLYHHSTVDGPGRRSVVQFAGCSIRCPGCYVPETHERTNGKIIPIENIIAEIEKRSGEHDGVTILGGEPFDQPESLEVLVNKLKVKGFHLVIYSGYTVENLLERKSERIKQILANTDLLIDGAFKRELNANAGEYRGSSNQRLILYPILRLR